MYERILLPVDGSDGSTEALYHAGEIAQWSDGTIQLLNVADTARDSVTVVDGDVVDALAEAGDEVLEEAGRILDSLDVDYSADVIQGDPVSAIVDYAAEYDYDVIVMPTQGRDGVSEQLLGSVTEKVVRLASRPVLTVRTGTDRELAFPYERLVVPTDGSSAAMHAAEHALDVAEAVGATVHVLAVVDDAMFGIDVRSAMAETAGEDAAREAVENVVLAAESRDIDVVEHVERGSAHEEILDCVAENGAHAVVMGTTGKRGVDRILLGSVAEKTVRTSPVPVVTVREEE
ncbi:universal stress protein [Halogeometricum limi]|uniref:Nucleotide-binding universal stress protein, UspA family n=1 Tax=Halogeometricum limi TaxID=555875 RepID=A0A1I6GNE3_9EURY|nr:universal stress protein [Halogeometricum limi]SFR43752.1 Nucleotide-binding universal stress protein, UspA family [Halogeometricum limi]